MKVLSLTEPYATLIMEKTKKIETRSWKTKYRGELYIHASSTHNLITDKKLLNLVKRKSLNYGNIIHKCELFDCILIDNNFMDKIKKDKQEYICGIYEVGRYAWILKNIEILDKPIFVKGKLGIWEYTE